MEEASRVKFYLVKYFFLANAVLQWIASVLIFSQSTESPKRKAVSFILFALSLIFVSLHFMVASKIKKVAVSKKKMTVVDKKMKSYDWDEVKQVKFIPFINMYCAVIKKKRKIYFLPPNNSKSLFGMFSEKQDFIPKKISKA
jgi:hypothetical protein